MAKVQEQTLKHTVTISDDATDSLEHLPISQRAVTAGVRVLRQETSLVLWAVCGQIIGAFFGLLPFLIIVLSLSNSLAAVSVPNVGQGRSAVFNLLLSVADWVTTPSVIIGTTGLFFITSLTASVINILIESGVLGTLRRRLFAGEAVISNRLFWKSLGERFEAILTWNVARTLLISTTTFSSLATVWLTWRTLIRHNISPYGTISEAMLFASAIAMVLVIGLIALVLWVVLLELSLPRVVLLNEGVAVALWGALETLARRPMDCAGLFLKLATAFGAVGLVAAPLMLGVQLLNGEPDLAAPAALLQAIVEFALTIALATVAVGCRGVLLAFVGFQDGILKKLPSLPTMEVTSAKAAKTCGLVSQVPHETPYIVSCRDLLQRLDEDVSFDP